MGRLLNCARVLIASSEYDMSSETTNNEWPLVSVIILNYNGREYLERCLKSVLNTAYTHFEVIFVDNASTDGSVNYVEKTFGSHLRIICNDKNLGFAEGNNVGAKCSKGKYVVFLNNDTEVDRNWLKEIIKVMESDPAIAVAQSKLLLTYNRKKLDCAGVLIDYMGYAYRRGAKEYDVGQYNEVAEVFGALGAAMAIRRDVLSMIGLFDPKFCFYYEETDFCWRVWLSGYKVVFVPTSIVYHAVGGTMKKTLSSSVVAFYMCKNHIAMLLKNYQFYNLVKFLPRYITLVCAIATYFMLKGKINRSVAYAKAIIWNILNFKYVWAERLKVQHLIRKMLDEEINKKLVLSKPLFIHDFLHAIFEGKLI